MKAQRMNLIRVASHLGVRLVIQNPRGLTPYMYPLSNQRVLNTEIIPEVISQKIRIMYSSGDTTNK